MHYHRWYRHGDVNKTQATSGVYEATKNPTKYKTMYKPKHPLATKNGHVYVHRMILFDIIGEGWHDCHWCGRSVTWGKRGSDMLQVDHIDGDKGNNTPGNLVPSCPNCNLSRGQQKRHQYLKDRGWFSEHDTVGILSPRIFNPETMELPSV